MILCHRPPHHIATLAERHPDAHYYIHYDAKSSLNDLRFLKNKANIHILPNRVAIFWGGFSLILATLNLFQAALANPHNRHFHLLSGDCLPLRSPTFLREQMAQSPENTLWMTSTINQRLRYRTRFDAPHADTVWQRHLAGKMLTKALQFVDKILPSAQKCYAGSQWFSANRVALEILFKESLGDYVDFFERKLCPDEHFFQTINAQLADGIIHHINANHRYICFASASANHPDFLSLDDLSQARDEGYWFARKVKPEQALQFLATAPEI